MLGISGWLYERRILQKESGLYADSPVRFPCMLNAKKTPEDVLQEEILKERAEVLRRAGERLSEAIDRVNSIGLAIEELKASLKVRGMHGAQSAGEMMDEINGEIRSYNAAREQAKLRYYYMIVTREALGMRRHRWVEEMYRIPPKKKSIREI